MTLKQFENNAKNSAKSLQAVQNIGTQLNLVQSASKAGFLGAVPTVPELSSGGRTFIQIGGKPLILAMDFNYTITAETEEIRTIDTNLPWDVAIGQIKISGTLRRFVHPDDSAEANGLFHTMQSFIHQPYVELLLQDANGNTLLYAKGMFTGITGQISRGQMTTQSATFTGVAYQQWAYQEFKPYSDKGFLSGISSGLKGIQKSLSGVGL